MIDPHTVCAVSNAVCCCGGGSGNVLQNRNGFYVSESFVPVFCVVKFLPDLL
jgi:hypothetical protein